MTFELLDYCTFELLNFCTLSSTVDGWKAIKTFSVYKHPALGYRAVKAGFSWPGLFFSGIWLLVKRLWGYALAFLSLTFLLSFLEVSFEQKENLAGRMLIIWLEIGLYIFVGAKGNEWYAANLKKRGFTLVETVQAETPDGAIAKIPKL